MIRKAKLYHKDIESLSPAFVKIRCLHKILFEFYYSTLIFVLIILSYDKNYFIVAYNQILLSYRSVTLKHSEYVVELYPIFWKTSSKVFNEKWGMYLKLSSRIYFG